MQQVVESMVPFAVAMTRFAVQQIWRTRWPPRSPERL